MIVCVCNAVSDRQIRRAAQQGARTLRDLRQTLPVATCCGKCASCARRILDQEAVADVPLPSSADALPIPA